MLVALAAASLAGMLLWSFATQWRFPDALPSGFALEGWTRRLAGLAGPALNTLALGVVSVALALALVLACLEHESARPQRGRPPALALLYLPLLVPQVAFLFGAQVLLVRAGADGTFAAVVWAHLVFVLPYLFLSLADPWRALDPRYARTAASLGAGRWRIFATVKLPILARPLAIACAVGVRGERRALPADALRRQRPRADADDGGRHAGVRRGPARHRRLRRWRRRCCRSPSTSPRRSSRADACVAPRRIRAHGA